MIKINLIPPEIKKKKTFDRYMFFLLGAASLSLLAVIGVFFFLGLKVNIEKTRHNRLAREWEAISKEENEVLGLEKLREELDIKRRAIQDLAQSRLLWSGKLYELSREVLPSIWLTELRLSSRSERVKVPVRDDPRDRKRRDAPQVTWVTKAFQTVVIRGVVISLGGEEMIDSIGKFMTSLKENQDFFSDFQSIELIYTQRGNIKGVETMSFELACLFK